MSKIVLNDMEFYAYHGCLEHEKKIGNHFWVTVSFHIDSSEAEHTDKLTDTLSYAEVYDVVKREMNIPSNLVENVCGRIYRSICNEFPQLERVKVSLRKANPPLGGKVKDVTIEIGED